MAQGPWFLSQAVTSSTGPHCPHPGLEQEGPLSTCCPGQFKPALLLYGMNFPIPCGASHSFMALNTALQPGCHRSPSPPTPRQQDSEMCLSNTCCILTQPGTKAQLQPSLVCFAEGGDGSPSLILKVENYTFNPQN